MSTCITAQVSFYNKPTMVIKWHPEQATRKSFDIDLISNLLILLTVVILHSFSEYSCICLIGEVELFAKQEAGCSKLFSRSTPYDIVAIIDYMDDLLIS
uniref:Uncharacterized protein n=1 Tax=Romanomermis culicivorax TaxID=13658 RepID=A0A915IHS3_ROMCU